MADESTTDWAINNLAGTYTDAASVARKLREAAKYCHLIGGAAITPAIEGHDVQIVVIPINMAETYPIKGREGDPVKRGIGKSTIMTIANAAGVEWEPPQRVDDGSIPRYCQIHVRGRYRTIDGAWRPVEGDRDMDLRDGSDEIADRKPGEVAAWRANMLRNAITKAKLRALREAFGVSQGMLVEELEKPFVFAKAIFTGRSNDPRLQLLFGQVIALQQLAASAAMYGGKMPELVLPSAEPPRQLTAHVVDVTPDGEVVESPPQRRAPPSPSPSAGPRPQNGSGNSRPGPAVWPWKSRQEGDPEKGTPIEKIETPDLERLIAYCDKKAAEGGQYADRDAALAQAARDVVAKRQKAQPQAKPAQQAKPQTAPEPPPEEDNDGGAMPGVDANGNPT